MKFRNFTKKRRQTFALMLGAILGGGAGWNCYYMVFMGYGFEVFVSSIAFLAGVTSTAAVIAFVDRVTVKIWVDMSAMDVLCIAAGTVAGISVYDLLRGSFSVWSSGAWVAGGSGVVIGWSFAAWVTRSASSLG